MEKPFDDGAHFLFVNGEFRDSSPLGLLMQDFFCTEPEDMYYAPLRERVRYFKEDEKGVKIMSSASEELREEGRAEWRAEWRAEGRAEGRAEFVRRLLEHGKLSCEEIAKLADLPLELVLRLSKAKPA